MAKSKKEKLEKYAEAKGHSVDREMTERLRNSLSDAKINIRVPQELKEELMNISKRKNIPYQRYIKSLLVDAVAREKAS